MKFKDGISPGDVKDPYGPNSKVNMCPADDKSVEENNNETGTNLVASDEPPISVTTIEDVKSEQQIKSQSTELLYGLKEMGNGSSNHQDNGISNQFNSAGELVWPLGDALRWNESTPEQKYLFMGIPDGPGLTLVVSPAKSGKTILMENLAFALALDHKDFLGYPIPSNKRILYISCEEYLKTRLQRTKLQMEGLKKRGIEIASCLEKIMFNSIDFPRYIRSDKEFKTLLDAVNTSNPDIVIIDSLTRMYTGALETSAKAQMVIQPLKNLSDNLERPIILIHHTTKLYNESLTMDSMAGSRILSQECDAIIGIGKATNSSRYVKPLAYRYADDTADKVDAFSINNYCLVDYAGKFYEDKLIKKPDGRQKTANKDILLETIMNFGKTSGPSLEEKIGKNQSMSRSTMYDNLHKLEKDGLISKSENGEYVAIPGLVDDK